MDFCLHVSKTKYPSYDTPSPFIDTGCHLVWPYKSETVSLKFIFVFALKGPGLIALTGAQDSAGKSKAVAICTSGPSARWAAVKGPYICDHSQWLTRSLPKHVKGSVNDINTPPAECVLYHKTCHCDG